MSEAPRRIQVFPVEFVKSIAEVLGQTETPGLSNREIDQLLAQVGVHDRPAGNKRDSLYFALVATQSRQSAGNVVAGFIAKAMHPSRYARDPARFTDLRDSLNESIIFFGWTAGSDGRLRRTDRARNLHEGAALAGRLLTELTRRGMHAELHAYCSEELIAKSLFHAVAEASKSIPSRVRKITGLAGDGSGLYDGVFGTGGATRPALLINDYRTESEVSEHKGFKNLLLGIHGHYRNPRAHSSRVDASENLADFYDAFSLFSYVHRRLDGATTSSQ